MTTAKMSGFLRHLTRGMAAETLRDRPDRELINRFLAHHDDAVFEVLVRRHGPMVYRVCWRVLHHWQNTEDAFQATFLVLAQKLRSVRKWDSLASWLHGVAHRVALKVQDQSTTRRRHERRAAVTEAVPPDEITWKEFHTALDAELNRLPDRLRLPLILCYLEGRTQEEAASQLGWSKSTLLRRLDEARTALRRRLTRRGVVWPAAVSAVLVSDCIAPAALPLGLIGSTVEVSAGVATGKSAAGLISAKVASLTQGVFKAMLLTKLKAATGLLLGVVISFAGAGILIYRTQAAIRAETEHDPQKLSRHQPADCQAPSQPIKRDDPGPDTPKTPPKLDRARIQGTWNLMVEKTEKSGSNVPPSLKVFSMTFKGEKLITKSKDPSGKETTDEGSFQLDQSTDPKSIAFNLGNDQFKGVYILLDDELIMAWTKAAEFQGTGAALLKFPWIFRRAATPQNRSARPGTAAKESRADKSAWREMRTMKHEHAITAIACSSDWSVAGDDRGSLVAWDTKTGKNRTPLQGGGKTIDRLQFTADEKDQYTPDGKSLYVICGGGTGIFRYFVKDKKFQGGHGFGVGDDGKMGYLGVSADAEVQLEFLGKGLTLRRNVYVYKMGRFDIRPDVDRNNPHLYDFVEYQAKVNHALLSAGDKWLAVATKDGTLHIHDRASLKETHTIAAGKEGVVITDVQFSADGQRIAVARDDALAKVYDTAKGEEVATLKGHSGIVFTVAFSPDGKTVVTGGDDNTARVWDAATGKEIATLQGHTDSVRCAAFDPSGEILVTGSADKTVKLWTAK
jgi:RNA polymerase sigma factor (sigma-70 family)